MRVASLGTCLIWQVFVFAPTKIRQGPFHFVFGSHRNTEVRRDRAEIARRSRGDRAPQSFIDPIAIVRQGKLRWLHHRSRHLLNETSMKRIGALKMRSVGPFTEVRPRRSLLASRRCTYTWVARDVGQATHGFDGSLRFLGFDPIRGIPSAVTSLGEYGFKPPTPITVADGLMLVVVDTSGLHYRGYARPGELNVNLLVWPERAGPWGRRDLGLSFAVISAMIRHKLGDYYRRSRRIYASQASSAWRRGWRARAAAAAAACHARTRTCARRLWTNAELSYYCEAASSD